MESRRPFSNAKDIIEIEAYTLYQSEKAIKVDVGDRGEIWLPISQLEEWPDVGQEGVVWMPEWLAKEKGLI